MNGFKLQTLPNGLIKTEILDFDENFPKNDIYETPEEVKKHLKHQKTQFQSYAKNIIDFLNISHGKLLDVGCGFGWVVKEAEVRGFDAKGIDQSKVYTDLGRKTLNVDLKNISLEKYKTSERFDVVILNHVLEHIDKPPTFLKKIKTLLKEKGILFIASPNIDSLMFKIFRNKWYGLQPYQHVWQFTPNSINNLLAQSGLRVVKMQTKNLDYQVKGLKGYFFKLIMFVAPKINQGDQVFLIAEKHDKSNRSRS